MAVHSQPLFQLFSLYWSVHLLLINFVFSMRRPSIFYVTQNFRRIYWHSQQQYLELFCFFRFRSTSLILSYSHSTFSSSFNLSFFVFSYQPPPPIPLVEISRNKRKAPSWMERFIIFSSHLANCPVSVHIWSVDNWIVPYLRDLLTLSQRTFDILLWSSLL